MDEVKIRHKKNVCIRMLTNMHILAICSLKKKQIESARSLLGRSATYV